MASDFDALLLEAARQPFSGWDFSYLEGRMSETPLPWNYAALVRRRLSIVNAVLDMGTGGGEFLSSLTPLPARTVATETYAPNVPIARARLEPLGVQVVQIDGAPNNVDIERGEGIGTLPFEDGSFPLVINRHESYFPAEVRRILGSGGRFLTQQVGRDHNVGLNELLGATKDEGPAWNLRFAVRQLEEAGLRIVDRRESHPETVFADIGAVVYYLKAVPWQVPGFSVARYRERLQAVHERMEREGPLRIRGHFFYLEAKAPETKDSRDADLGRYLDLDGRVSAWPAKRKNQLFVLAYLAERFQPGRKYSEPEVNEVLQQWHTWGDPAQLRRALFDERFMARTDDGSHYWRTGA